MAQTLPHAPQLSLSVAMFTHVVPPSPQSPNPVAHAHCPPLHTMLASHAWPQAPQWFASVWVLVQTLLQRLSPLAQPQVPLSQASYPFVQGVPQRPQLRGSLVVSVHSPLQQDAPPHVSPQPPQLFGSEAVSAMPPELELDEEEPVEHDISPDTHWPSLHTCSGVHTLSHVPQFFGSQ